MQENKIKILHIITRLDKGGSAENVILTCAKLDQTRYIPILVYGLTALAAQQLIGCRFKTYQVPELIRKISPLKDLIAFLKILRIIKKEKPHIVHTHTSKAGFIGRLAACTSRFTLQQLQSMKIIHTPHGHVFYGYFNRFKSVLFVFLERLISKLTHKLIALSEGEMVESLKFGVGRSSQWVVVHSGVEVNSRFTVQNPKLKSELNIPDDAIVIGTVARLEPVKGVKYLIKAVGKIYSSGSPVPNLRFLIVGDGGEREKLELLAEKLKIKDRVIFTGWKDNIKEMISLMDIYVQPSLNEGMGKTLIYAQMLKKPIIATKVQGIPSIVMDGKAGILVEPKNSFALAEAMMKLIEDSALRRKMGEFGYEFVNETVDGFKKFSIEYMIFKLHELYEKVLYSS